MSDEKIKKIISIIKDAIDSPGEGAKKPPKRKKPATPKQPVKMSAVGNGNIQVGRDFNITIGDPKPPKQPKPDVKPGVEHITDEQASIIQGLVKEIAEIEASVKNKPNSFVAIWSGLNSHMKVPQYRLILLGDFDKAIKYLRMWKGRLNAAPSAKKKNKNWRNTRLSAIHATAKNFGLEPQMRAYIMKKYNASSLTELTDDELDATYRYMLSAKKEVQKKSKFS